MEQQTIHLNGTWAVCQGEFSWLGMPGLHEIHESEREWLEAVVPGEIHLDLMRAGRMPEPTVGTNMRECRWPETRSWWFRREFELDARFLECERHLLTFDGLDLYAQVFVNGALLGECANAFVPQSFDARGQVRPGTNELVVRLTAGSELARDATPPGADSGEYQANPAVDGAIPNPAQEDDLTGHRRWFGYKWLRKPQFSYGWDWVDPLPNIGIWRGVRLEGRQHAILHSLRLDTLRRERGVALELEAVIENLHPWSERACALELDIEPPHGAAAIRRCYELSALPGRSAIRGVIEVPNPQLWWPNTMGDQPLYRVTARVTNGEGRVCDSRSFSIGLRTVEIDRSPLPEGSRFCIRVNGQEVFCRGGNTGPHDPILARISDAKYEALVSEARDANMNMLRINGCAIYEAPAFYDACDRAGMLVWHDFMLTCTTYPEHDSTFCESVRLEAEAAVRSLQHHPSIALWCGNNECNWFFSGRWNPEGAEPVHLGGQQLYSQVLPDLCRQLDPHRPYWISSPCGGELPNSEEDGDCHWWYGFAMHEDVNRRVRHEAFDECRARFSSEYGVIGPCHLDSMREYLAPDEMHPESTAWRVHTNTFEKNTVPVAIRTHYTDPETLTVPDYVLYGQVFQAVIHGYAIEASRFRKHDPVDDCAGALIWSYSDCWGETGWSILDYYLRRKASYYWFRRACAPVKVIVRRRDDRLVTRLVNDTLQAVNCTVERGRWRLDGGDRDFSIEEVTIPPNDMLEVGTAPVPDADDRDPKEWGYAAVLRDEHGTWFDQSIWLALPFRQLAVSPPQPSARLVEDRWLEVSSPVYCHAVRVEDHGHEVISDNWFNLIPGVPIRTRVADGVDPADLVFEAIQPMAHENG